MAVNRPPLALSAELVYPDGTTTRWDSEAREARNEPTGISFKTQRYAGFGDGKLTLNRDIRRDYPDLGLLDSVNLVGYDGSVAYEGRIAALPRSTGSQIEVQAQGWMGHAEEQAFVEVFVDRDLSKWQAVGAAYHAGLVAAGYNPTTAEQAPDETGEPALITSGTGAWTATSRLLSEAWWKQPGINIGKVAYAWTRGTNVSNADSNWTYRIDLDETDQAGGAQESANLLAAGPGSGLIEANTTTKQFARILFLYAAAGGGANWLYAVYWHKLAVYGTHNLPLHPAAGEPGGGIYVSDMIKNIASRWAPKLDTTLVQATTFPVPHASFLAETTPYQAFQALNAYHRWEMNVYEKRRLEYRPITLTDWDWEVRQSDPGVNFSLQGDEIGVLANGVIVRYTDINKNYEERLTPASHPELRDTNPSNPANVNGVTRYTTLSLTVPVTEEAALQIGRAYLAEFNQPKAPGTITIKGGYVKDRAGHWQPAWKVRASDRIIISDLASDRVRVVGETDYSHDSKELKIGVDGAMKRLDAVLARLGVAVESSQYKL